MDSVWLIALVIAVGISVAIIVTIIGYLRIVIGMSSVLSLNTKCMAIGWKYMRKENLQSLYESKELSEIASSITTAGYRISSENARAMERDLEKEYIRIMSEIKAFSPDTLKKFVESYMLKFDISIVMRILTAKLNRVPKNLIHSEVYPVNSINRTILEHMIDAENIDDAVRCLDATPFKKCIETWESTKDILKLEFAMEKLFFEELKDSTKTGDENIREAIKRFVGKYIDIHNLKTVTRCIFMGIKNAEEYIVDGGHEIPPWKIKNMLETDSIEAALSQIEGTSYYRFLRDVQPDIIEIEKRLDMALLKALEEIHMTFSNSIGPTLRFIVMKEYEVNNLKAIIRGIENKVPLELYEEVLITCE